MLTTEAVQNADALQLLRTALDSPAAEFRAGQGEAIRGVLEPGGRHLVVQRTGWGKSMVFFIATRILRAAGAGPTLVISPLLALMRDQVLAAERLGLRAERIDSSNGDEWPSIEAALAADQVDLLYVSPERLANTEFTTKVLLVFGKRIELLVIDEAHCISDWGHDFRPDYRRIRLFLDYLPKGMHLLAVTATASDRVVQDLEDQLGPGLSVSRGDLVRDSLTLQAITMPSTLTRYAWLAEHLPQLPGSGIIYVLTIRDAVRVASWLQQEGVTAEPYWGHQEKARRIELENGLRNNDLKAVVATSALAMGFDKPDLGFVIHFQRPQSVVHYYQQVGRAGRAIPEALGILLSGAEDEDILGWYIRSAFPDPEEVDRILHHLRRAGDAGRTTRSLQGAANIQQGRLERALKFLACESPAPLRKESGRWFANSIGEYQLPSKRMAAVNETRRNELAEMRRYVETNDCLMMFLQRALDDAPENIKPCGRCATCIGRPLVAETIDAEIVERARIFLDRQYVEIEPRKQWPRDLSQIEERGWSLNIGALKVEAGRALCHFSDPIRGEAIRKWKSGDSACPQHIVEDMLEMLRVNWRPDPSPTWVACVPSLRSSTRVPTLARAIASGLGLQLHERAIEKTYETDPQKMMQNSWHQVRNIINAFRVTLPEGLSEQPVLLIDDLVDSRWTFTVVGTLLREAGTGPVFPLAVASTASATE